MWREIWEPIFYISRRQGADTHKSFVTANGDGETLAPTGRAKETITQLFH